MKVLLTAATGMVGGCALRRCLAEPDVSGVTIIGRRTAGVSHPKVREVLHDDFSDFSKIADAFSGQDVAFFCLGAYTGSMPDDAFRAITVDTTIAFARVLREQSPTATFCFLSGQGADPSGQSQMAFARYKGIAENGLQELGFPRLHIFRPAYIYPVTPRDEPNLMYRVSRWLYPVLRWVIPNSVIPSEELALAMVYVGLRDTHAAVVLENRDIRALAQTRAP